METLLPVVFLAPLALALAGCQTNRTDLVSEAFPADQKAVEKTIREIFDAAQNRELDKLEAFHLRGPKFTKFDDAGEQTRQDDRAAIRAEREQLAGAAEFQASLHNLKVDVFGEVAVATLEPEFLVRTGEATFQGKDRSTFVLVKTDQGWKIAHEHHSPFRQNSRTP